MAGKKKSDSVKISKGALWGIFMGAVVLVAVVVILLTNHASGTGYATYNTNNQANTNTQASGQQQSPTPTITSTPVTQVNEGSSYAYQVVASSPRKGSTLSYSLLQAPSWLSIDSSTGFISGNVPQLGSDSSYNIEVQVYDGTNSVNQNYVLTTINTCKQVQVPYQAQECNAQYLSYNVKNVGCNQMAAVPTGFLGLGNPTTVPANYTIEVNNLDSQNGGDFTFFIGFKLPGGGEIGQNVTQYIYPLSSAKFTYSSDSNVSNCIYNPVAIPTKQVCQYVTKYKTETQCS